MTSRRPPSQRDAAYIDQRQSRQIQSMVPGASLGRLASAGPVSKLPGPADALFGFSPSTVNLLRASMIDPFTLTSDGPQDLTLTFVPVENSWNVSLNGVLADEDLGEISLSGQTLSLLSPLDARSGDQVRVQYDYLGTTSAPISDDSSEYVAAVKADSPLVYYRMNGTGSSETDISGHARHGSMTGNYLRGRPSLLDTDTDASTDFGNPNQGSSKGASGFCTVVCPYDSGLITPDWTWEFWTNKGSSSNTACFQWTGRLRLIVGNTFQVHQYTDATNFSLVANSSTGLLSNSDYATVKHLAVTYDGAADTVIFYRNGAQFDVVTGVTTALRATTNDISMGFNDGADGLADGDEFAFYGTALSASRIAAHWAAR